MRLQAGGVQRTGKPSGLKRVPYTVFSLHMEESNMKKMKRIISAALTLALAAGMLAGCAGSSSGTPAASSAGGSSSAERERITVRVFRSKASHEVAMDQMDVFKVMGEMFNIDFEFDNPPQENYTERLNLVMMETELPDVIMEIPVTDVLKYGETGVILPLKTDFTIPPRAVVMCTLRGVTPTPAANRFMDFVTASNKMAYDPGHSYHFTNG